MPKEYLDNPPLTAAVSRRELVHLLDTYLGTIAVMRCEGCALALCDEALNGRPMRGKITAMAALRAVAAGLPEGETVLHIPCNTPHCEGVELSNDEFGPGIRELGDGCAVINKSTA